MADSADVELACALDALQKRVAALEVVLGRVSDDTCCDVPDLAASALGQSRSAVVERGSAARKRREEQVAEAVRVAVILEQQK